MGFGHDLLEAAEERADDRVTASGVRPDAARPARPAGRGRRGRRGPSRGPAPAPPGYDPPVVRPSRAHVEAGRVGLARSREALAAADNDEDVEVL